MTSFATFLKSYRTAYTLGGKRRTLGRYDLAEPSTVRAMIGRGESPEFIYAAALACMSTGA